MTTITNPRGTTEDDITAEVLRRFDTTAQPRLRQVMQSLVRHLHAFVKDVELTEAEWMTAIQFLTETGHMCDDKRQEFILLSDTLGVSMVVDLIDHRQPAGATESTVFGPFHRDGAPDSPSGGNIAPRDKKGIPTIVSGRVLTLDGGPIAGARLDVWQADSKRSALLAVRRGRRAPSARTIPNRRGLRVFAIRNVRPRYYAIPTDGPVGRMLTATNRHPWRPAHIHFVVSAEGYEPVTTHIFDNADPYLESDTVFAVKDSLMCTFVQHDVRDADAVRVGLEPPFCTARFDFVLRPVQR